MNNDIKKSPVSIGVMAPKGGVGKSTICVLLASILSYDFKYSVHVLDCDSNQNSINALRIRDDGVRKLGGSKVKRMLEINKAKDVRWYCVEKVDLSDSVSRLCELKENEDLDVILVDAPGSSQNSDYFLLSFGLDYLICPIEEDMYTLSKVANYAIEMKKYIGTENVSLKELFVVWNKIQKSTMKTLFEDFNRILRENSISRFDSVLYNSVRFSRELYMGLPLDEVFRCTLMSPFKKTREGTGIDEFVEEVISKCITER